MNDEIVKIYNEDGVYLNQMISKKEAKQKNLFHKAVHVWIMIENKILIQQRSETKKIFPDKWDISVAGHLIENESSLNTVIREVKEELNIDLDKNQIEFLYSLRRTGETAGNIFFDTYLVKLPSNFDLSLIKLQSNEVKNIKMVNIDYLKKVVTEEDITFAPRKYECKMLIDYFK